MTVPTMEGITAKTITTPRLTTRVLFSGDDNGIPVVFVHGNVSSATFWEELMLTLPAGYRGIAPDNRGYGGADPGVKIDSTRGMGDLSDDVAALMDTLGIEKAHMVGHSLGGSVLWRFMMDYPQRILTVTVAAPGSPYGYGGTKDLDGTPCHADFAGSGGGVTNQDFVKMVAEGYRGTEYPVAPRNIMNNFYWKPPFKPAREEDLLSSMISIHVGEQDWAGDFGGSPNWPNVTPGKFGPNNALSPKYAGDVSRLYAIDPKPSVLWVRGADDQIVSDASFFDMGTLGALGFVPGYPGKDIYPSQPMVGQTRVIMEKYQAAGGQYQEVVFENCGHSPYIEKLDEFNAVFHPHIGAK